MLAARNHQVKGSKSRMSLLSSRNHKEVNVARHWVLASWLHRAFDHEKDFGFRLKWNTELLEDFEQRDVMSHFRFKRVILSKRMKVEVRQWVGRWFPLYNKAGEQRWGLRPNSNNGVGKNWSDTEYLFWTQGNRISWKCVRERGKSKITLRLINFN